MDYKNIICKSDYVLSMAVKVSFLRRPAGNKLSFSNPKQFLEIWPAIFISSFVTSSGFMLVHRSRDK